LVEAQKRESQKEIEKYRQDAEAQAKAAIKDFEKSKLEARLIRLEALMKTLGR